ncbi:MAG: hypothetical protein L0K03_02595 [Bifidobacterium crudilactis]|nr:hypothetical protein [Bifidobacterium crudilactis]
MGLFDDAKKAAKDAGDKVAEAASDVKDAVSEKFSEATDKASDKASDKLDEAKASGKAAGAEAEKAATEAKNAAKDKLRLTTKSSGETERPNSPGGPSLTTHRRGRSPRGSALVSFSDLSTLGIHISRDRRSRARSQRPPSHPYRHRYGRRPVHPGTISPKTRMLR